ncbi:MAG: YicC/YloC family endoribonuclease [Ahrensia sp.]
MIVSPDLQSMTGFASATSTYEVEPGETVCLRCEIRSVNGKGLDVRARFADGMETVERAVKKIAADAMSRGSLQVALTVETTTGKTGARIDEALFSSFAHQAKMLAAQNGLQAPSADAILSIRGVVTNDDGQSGALFDEAVLEQAMTLCQDAVEALTDNRRSEGAVIAALIAKQIDEIEQLVHSCAHDPALDSTHIRALLSTQLNRLLDADEGKQLDADRLHVEAALLATKSDIREELDRLTAHIAAARTLLAEGGPIGRKLDFLCQEFNRETNTLCSKSSTSSLTAIGLAMKAVVDQMKEQAANLQ